jgi:PKD repeat protein
MYFTATSTGTNTISFNALNSVSPCNAPGKFLWNYGDGTFTSNMNSSPIHVYPSSGTYTVSLTTAFLGVYDEGICGSNYTATVVVPFVNPFPHPESEKTSKKTGNTNFVVISPNPATSLVNVKFNLENSGKVEFIVRSIEGKELSREFVELSKGKQDVEVILPKVISDGMVLLEVNSTEFKEVKTIVIKN